MHKILIIDDEIINIKILMAALSDHHEVIFATSGKKGLAAIVEHKPSLIILDIVMQEMDGFEVMKQHLANPDHQDIPVIFISGMDSEEHEEYGLSLGAVDYIYKPFHISIAKMRVANQIKIIELKKELAALKKVVKLSPLRDQAEALLTD